MSRDGICMVPLSPSRYYRVPYSSCSKQLFVCQQNIDISDNQCFEEEGHKLSFMSSESLLFPSPVFPDNKPGPTLGTVTEPSLASNRRCLGRLSVSIQWPQEQTRNACVHKKKREAVLASGQNSLNCHFKFNIWQRNSRAAKLLTYTVTHSLAPPSLPVSGTCHSTPTAPSLADGKYASRHHQTPPICTRQLEDRLANRLHGFGAVLNPHTFGADQSYSSGASLTGTQAAPWELSWVGTNPGLCPRFGGWSPCPCGACWVASWSATPIQVPS